MIQLQLQLHKKKNYKILCNQNSNDEDNTYTSQNDNIEDTKWTILANIPNKIHIQNKIDINTSENIVEEKQYISPSEIYKCYNEMSKRWNRYRDEINNICGDTSPYWNYRNIIHQMIDENNIIYSELYENDNNYSSDDDGSDYEYNDFYYK